MKTDLQTSLRLNNIVQSTSGVYLVVKEIMASGITYDRLDGTAVVGHAEWEEVEPVGLTVEWLEKCGFELTEYYARIGKLTLKQTYDGYVPVGERYAIGVEIKYVHQLQNLYQSLTGEELTINL